MAAARARRRRSAPVPASRLVLGYTRVSTDKQADEGVSLDAQAARLQALAVVHDLPLAEVIVDAGESAKSLQRPGMAQLLALVDTGRVATILVVKLDRLTRNVRDLAELLERFERHDVALVSASESLDTRSPSGRLMLNLLTSVGQWEREEIGARTRAALQHKKSAGLRVGTVKFGYQVGADGRTLEPHAGEQRALALIAECRAAGFSQCAIAEALNRQGLRTRRGSTWRHQYVANLLRAA